MRVLVVEDDIDFRELCARWFTRQGHQTAQAGSGQEALDHLAQRQCDVAILDMNLPGLTGLELLGRIRETDLDTEVIILTGEGTVETAVQAMKMGACDYLTKPFPLPELEQRCRMAFDRGRIRKENRQLRALIDRDSPRGEMIGESPAMQAVFQLIERVAPSDKSVLIQGESGTGKELAALAIYRGSTRSDKPFVTVNCAALPEHLVESELFGHEKGAFTGATAHSPGLFEVADGGTLFIDEIGELPQALQPKLLRVLEDGSLRRVGSVKERHVDVRVLAATNRDLLSEVKAKHFREDLYYRINVVQIDLPPLRDLREDIPLLLDHIVEPGWTIEPEAREALLRCRWPGNVRQLKNTLDRAMILADDRVITLDDLPREVAEESSTDSAQPTETSASDQHSDLASIERAHIVRVLEEAGGNKSRAARALGIHRRKLYRLLDRLGIPSE
ncbi:MAG: sigma-54-dependent Fis family transcriptional regulator [Planctomycetaceae bacterium]|nr:sigma-54-dependent Fis family transcriptional regulator [Planctomycetaceae bacterium]MBT6153900.1 sigma-54-dependent Fis family transcriptional regulator [Planctomycetaceae bacterium]MBT6486629.1 sigma-54-dependent Fis family transcriptional regulator [Planctomycetaceae bacterium]MBT6496821.1 sigma-54-dependent Fis family transcriptional regulator [Planctomycetaceae bacterium]